MAVRRPLLGRKTPRRLGNAVGGGLVQATPDGRVHLTLIT